MDVIDILIDTLIFGIPYAFLALGVFVTYRILDFADLTTEGSFVLGGAVAAVLIIQGVNPWIATLMAIIVGFIAGVITGLLHTKLHVPSLLSGIITLTALFSINMVIFGIAKEGSSYASSISIKASIGSDQTIFGYFSSFFELRKEYEAFALIIFIVLFAFLVYRFFGTEIGMSMRATGMNKKMASAQGINTTLLIVVGVGMANALIALGGALAAQRDYGIDVASGQGTIVIGLASIILGEAIFGKKSFLNWLISVILGSLVYYFIIALVIYLGFPNHLLKFLYALLITIILGYPIIKKTFLKYYNEPKRRIKRQDKNDNKALLKEQKLSLLQTTNIDAYNLIINKMNNKALKKANTENKRLEKELIIQQKIEKKALALKDKKKISLEVRQEKIKNKINLLETMYSNNNQKLNNKLTKKIKNLKNIINEDNNEDSLSSMLVVKSAVKEFNPTGNVLDVKVALNNLSLDVKKGEFITVIGSNGSGKSTFINAVSGVYELDDGQIIIGNENVTKVKEYKRSYYIGKVAQDPFLGTAPEMSILENLFIAKRRNKPKTLRWGFNALDTEYFKKLIKSLDLGLENRLTSKIGVLSGGQRQAITLLMATLEKPKLLLLDEHTAALDPKTASNVLELTDKVVRENGITTIMITHNMKDAIKYGNRLLMFNNGQIIYDVKGEEKKQLTVESLLKKFENQVQFSDKDILA